MKLYGSFLTIQSNGSRVYLILRSKLRKDLDESFYSLYNLGATEGKHPEYHAGTTINCVATCLSSWQKIQNYFYNCHKLKHNSTHNQAYLFALNQIQELKKEQNQEVFFNDLFEDKVIVHDGFTFGTADYIEEEIKDAILVQRPRPELSYQGQPEVKQSVVDDPQKIQKLLTVQDL